MRLAAVRFQTQRSVIGRRSFSGSFVTSAMILPLEDAIWVSEFLSSFRCFISSWQIFSTSTSMLNPFVIVTASSFRLAASSQTPIEFKIRAVSK